MKVSGTNVSSIPAPGRTAVPRVRRHPDDQRRCSQDGPADRQGRRHHQADRPAEPPALLITAALDAGVHRGWKGDPLYDIPKLLLLGAKSVNDTGWARLRAAFAAGDPTDALSGTWAGKEKVRVPHRRRRRGHPPPRRRHHLGTATEAGPELRTLARTLRRRRAPILAHHTTGASNGPVEAANLTIKQVKRSGRGFRNVHNYWLRILLAGGARERCQTQHVTSIRPRRPRLVA